MFGWLFKRSLFRQRMERGPGLERAPGFVVEKGKRYRAKITLDASDLWKARLAGAKASNAYIEDLFRNLGFDDPKVTGDGAVRFGEARWNKASQPFPGDPRISDVRLVDSAQSPDSDPAADLGTSAVGLNAAKARANYGDVDPGTYAATRGLHSEAAGPPAVMPIDIGVARAFLEACMSSRPRVTYGLGAKVPFFKAKPGIDFTEVDCSGFVREAIREATTPMTAFPDGSVVQHDWIIEKHFKKTTVASAMLVDDKVRIAFLSPSDTSSHIGHVVLIHNGQTLESHGGVGPDRRPWDGKNWQAATIVYELTGAPPPPTS